MNSAIRAEISKNDDVSVIGTLLGPGFHRLRTLIDLVNEAMDEAEFNENLKEFRIDLDKLVRSMIDRFDEAVNEEIYGLQKWEELNIQYGRDIVRLYKENKELREQLEKCRGCKNE